MSTKKFQEFWSYILDVQNDCYFNFNEIFKEIEYLIEEGANINELYLNEYNFYSPLCHALNKYCLDEDEDRLDLMIYKNKRNEYLSELIYFLLSKNVIINDDSIQLAVYFEKYKLLEDMLRIKISSNDKNDKNLMIICDRLLDTKYIEIMFGFSCININTKVRYVFNRKFVYILPIEILLLELSLYFTRNDVNITNITNNISLFKKYGTIEPSFDRMIDILSDKDIFSKKTSLKAKINLIDAIDYYKSL